VEAGRGIDRGGERYPRERRRHDVRGRAALLLSDKLPQPALEPRQHGCVAVRSAARRRLTGRKVRSAVTGKHPPDWNPAGPAGFHHVILGYREPAQAGAPVSAHASEYYRNVTSPFQPAGLVAQGSKTSGNCFHSRTQTDTFGGLIRIVSLVNVSKVYPPRTVALADVNLDIAQGEFLFLIGPSGAGKSTLIRLLYREEKPSVGQVLFDGRDVGRLKARQIPALRRQIGVVFQDFKLLPGRTVHENVAFPLYVTEWSPRDIRRRVPHVLELVGLAEKAQARPEELSGGEQQRASIARAMVAEPRLLIADEPTGNLDPETARGIMSLLLEINRRGATVVVATHSEAMVNSLRKRVVALDRGRVVRDEERGTYLREA
jgi:cell division transport system ATP-binding protein